ncbi:hypothetical protein OG271_30515 [Micromonospora rifamycinica]|uniref:hypothetical protein n=1 Tax=Micromonospora rifamycinica TaxID=291594 RepID=UPI002E2D59D9|nr:hypothetical protein [Micromonospora rifamycinica]
MAKYTGPDGPADTGSDREPERFAVRRMARLLEVSASGFYAWARRATAPEPTPWRYNHERRHSALGMLPPIRYEQSLTGTANAA